MTGKAHINSHPSTSNQMQGGREEREEKIDCRCGRGGKKQLVAFSVNQYKDGGLTEATTSPWLQRMRSHLSSRRCISMSLRYVGSSELPEKQNDCGGGQRREMELQGVV